MEVPETNISHFAFWLSPMPVKKESADVSVGQLACTNADHFNVRKAVQASAWARCAFAKAMEKRHFAERGARGAQFSCCTVGPCACQPSQSRKSWTFLCPDHSCHADTSLSWVNVQSCAFVGSNPMTLREESTVGFSK
jgi:hypothetical protein